MADGYGMKKISDGAWVLHQGGSPVGFIHQEGKKYRLLTTEDNTEYDSLEDIKKSIGGKVSDLIAQESDDGEAEAVSAIDGFPVKHANITVERGGDRPVYLRGKTQHGAGYWCIKFSKRWVPSFCPLLKTIEQYESMGPYKNRFEMMANLSTLNK